MVDVANGRIVVLGTGPAGGWAATSLRDAGFDGEILLVGEEPHLPYERPPLSKTALLSDAGTDAVPVHPEGSYRDRRIEWVCACATTIDAQRKVLQLSDGGETGFDKLVIATGCRPRRLELPGADLPGVHYLRTLEDARVLRERLDKARHVAVIGGGWIGLEVASTARSLGIAVTLLETAPRLCTRSLGDGPARFLKSLHVANGVDVRLGASIAGLRGSNRVEEVVLSDGAALSVDTVVVGIGALPNAEIAAAAGIEVDNGIVVDAHGRTSVEGIYAAGDVTLQPNSFWGLPLRLESWENAQNQGIHVARSIMGASDKGYDEVPWIWSQQHGHGIELMGFPPGPTDETVLLGSYGQGKFLEAYLRDGYLWGAIAVDMARELKVLRKLMQARIPVDRSIVELPVPSQLKLLRP